MSHSDLRRYKAKMEVPITGTFRGFAVTSGPPPSSGAILISCLQVLEGLELERDSAESMHQIIETFKHAYAERSYLGDPSDPVYTNITEISKLIISKLTAQEINRKIDVILLI